MKENSELEDGGFYWITMFGESTIGKVYKDENDLWILETIGWGTINEIEGK